MSDINIANRTTKAKMKHDIIIYQIQYHSGNITQRSQCCNLGSDTRCNALPEDPWNKGKQKPTYYFFERKAWDTNDIQHANDICHNGILNQTTKDLQASLLKHHTQTNSTTQIGETLPKDEKICHLVNCQSSRRYKAQKGI